MKKRKCKKKDCWNRVNGNNKYCTTHIMEIEVKALRVLNKQNKKEQ